MPPKTPRQSGASLPATPNLPTYSFGDIVLAKVKGHPAWPARIVDPYASPMNLRDERKITQKNSYLVKFFKTADFAWMNAKEMSMLEPPEIRAFINNPNKKGADLKAAYSIALAPEKWEAEMEEMQMAMYEQQQGLEIDELEPADAENAEKAVSAKSKQKRKRPSEPKTPASSTKKRKSVDARPVTAPAAAAVKASPSPESPAAAPAVKKRGKKKEEPVVPVDGEAVVREWRHRLQRLFLGKAALTEKMMPEIDGVFTDIEQFEMKTEWLTSSKLAKVLKRVGVLEDSKVPMDAQYNIRARARALQEKWRQQFGLGEESHRPKTSDGAEETKAAGSLEKDNGKENTDPTAAKKEEEVVANGKEHKKLSDPDDMKMDEDDTLPIRVAEESGEAKPLDDAAPMEEAVIAAPVQANGDHEAVPAEPEAANTAAEDVNGKPEATSAEHSAEPEAVNGKPDVTMDGPEAANGAGDDVATVEPEAVSGDTKAVNGDHHEAAKEDKDVTMADEKVEESPDAAEPATVGQKGSAPEMEDEAEQMDCAVTPEPTAAESTPAEKETAA